jgi:hypothetical protein
LPARPLRFSPGCPLAVRSLASRSRPIADRQHAGSFRARPDVCRGHGARSRPLARYSRHPNYCRAECVAMVGPTGMLGVAAGTHALSCSGPVLSELALAASFGRGHCANRPIVEPPGPSIALVLTSARRTHFFPGPARRTTGYGINRTAFGSPARGIDLLTTADAARLRGRWGAISSVKALGPIRTSPPSRCERRGGI